MTLFPPKVLYIALDAASRALVLELCSQGELPNIHGLMKTGAWAMTRNAPAVYTGSLWPTVWTGTSPGRHGCYYCEQLKPGSYDVTEFLAEDVLQAPFWNELSKAGKRIAMFDLPKAALSKQLNGIQIVDWGTHDAEVPACSWPPDLIEHIHAAYGASPFRRCDWVMGRSDPERRLLQDLLRRIETRLKIAEELMQREPWDLFMIGFGDSHCVGHQCWHLHNPTHPQHDPELSRRIGDPVREVYKALDSAVGRLVSHAGPETTVMLHCSHGMSNHYDATDFLDDVLRRLQGRPKPLTRSVLDRARKIWKKLPVGLTELFGSLADRVNRLPDASDRSDRDCFAVPSNANSAGIRINLAGREPNGRIEPGPEAEAFVSRLIGDLKDLTDPSDGRPLVREVIRSRDAFPGENNSYLPDLFIRWHREKPVTGVASPKIGQLAFKAHANLRTGDHVPGGMLVLRGPNVPEAVHLDPVKDEDIAPTLAACLGVALENADGQAIQLVRLGHSHSMVAGGFPEIS